MAARRIDRGTESNPLVAGDPFRLDVTLRSDSGHVGSLSAVDLSSPGDLRYAVFRMEGDLPANTPSFVRVLGDGIVVTSATVGGFAVLMPGSLTALWSGRDWHVGRYIDQAGMRFDAFDDLIVSSRRLEF